MNTFYMKGSLKSFIHWKQEITLSTQDEIYGTWDKPGLLYTFSSHFVLFSSSTNYDKIVFIKKDLIDISKKRKWMIYSVYPKKILTQEGTYEDFEWKIFWLQHMFTITLNCSQLFALLIDMTFIIARSSIASYNITSCDKKRIFEIS